MNHFKVFVALMCLTSYLQRIVGLKMINATVDVIEFEGQVMSICQR